MKITFTRASAIGHRERSRPGPAARLQGLVLIAGLFGAVAVGTVGTASAAVKTAVSPPLKASTVAAVTASLPPVGSYTATNPQNNEPITFYVSPNRTSVQDISIPFVHPTCPPPAAPTPPHP